MIVFYLLLGLASFALLAGLIIVTATSPSEARKP